MVVLIAYVSAVILFGCWFVRRSGTPREFMAAGGRIPGWAVGLSIFGTYLSSNTFLGVPGKAYGTNWNAFVFSLSLPLAAIVASKCFIPFYRRSGEISAYHHLEHKFGPWARTYAAICYLLTQVARMGAILFGVALGLNALTGWDIATVICVTGALVTIYTLLGGIEAVIWTDVVQACILMIGACCILALLLWEIPGGVSSAYAIAQERDKFSLGEWSLALDNSTVFTMLLYGFFINLNNFGIDQSFVQRFHTARSEKAASNALWLGALLYVPVSLLFFAIGTALYCYYESSPTLLDEVRHQVAVQALDADATDAELLATASKLTDVEIGDKVLPHFIANQLPTGMAGLLIAAIFAAAMSSVDTSLNSSATVLLQDVHIRYFSPQCSEQASMRFLRIATIAVGAIGTGVALALIGVKSILDAWWVLQGVFAGGVLGLFLLGMICKHPQRMPSIIATILGVLTLAWLTLSPNLQMLPENLRSGLHTNLTIVIGTLVIFLFGLLLNRIWSSNADVDSDENVESV